MKTVRRIFLVVSLILLIGLVIGCGQSYPKGDFDAAYQEGYEQGYLDGYEAGWEEGYFVGYEDGWADGYEEGWGDAFSTE